MLASTVAFQFAVLNTFVHVGERAGALAARRAKRTRGRARQSAYRLSEKQFAPVTTTVIALGDKLVSSVAFQMTVRNTFVHQEVNKAPAARRSLSVPCRSSERQLATEWFFDEANGKDTSSEDGASTVAPVASLDASSLTASAADINDFEGVHEEHTICEKASLSECDFRAYVALSSQSEARECLVEFREAMERDASISNAVLDRLWSLVWELECAWQRPGPLKQEESRVLQRAIQLAQASHVQQAVYGLVAMVQQATAYCCTDIFSLFQGFYANHIIQELCNTAAASDLQFLANALAPLAISLAQDRVACRILQRIFEHCSWEQCGMLPAMLLAGDLNDLCQSHFGGTVVTTALEHHPQFCRWVMDRIAPDVAKTKSGSYTYQALIEHSPMELLDSIFERLAQAGLPSLLLSRPGVESLKAFSRRGLDKRLADGLRGSIKEKHRLKSYAADLIKTLKI